MTTDQLWVGLATALNAGDEQAARQLLDGIDRVTIEALLLNLCRESMEMLAEACERFLGAADGRAEIAATLPLYALEVA